MPSEGLECHPLRWQGHTWGSSFGHLCFCRSGTASDPPASVLQILMLNTKFLVPFGHRSVKLR